VYIDIDLSIVAASMSVLFIVMLDCINNDYSHGTAESEPIYRMDPVRKTKQLWRSTGRGITEVRH